MNKDICGEGGISAATLRRSLLLLHHLARHPRYRFLLSKGGCAGGPNNAANMVHLSFTEPYALAADDTDMVYWAQGTQILSCPKAGCTNGTPVAVGQSGAQSLTIDRRTGCQSTLFWTNSTGGSVMALPL